MSHPSSVHSRKTSLRVTVYFHMYPPFSLIRLAYGPACWTSVCPASPSCSWARPFGRSWLECPRRLLAPPCLSLPRRSSTDFRSVTVRGCCPTTRPSPRIPGSATVTTPASCGLNVSQANYGIFSIFGKLPFLGTIFQKWKRFFFKNGTLFPKMERKTTLATLIQFWQWQIVSINQPRHQKDKI